MIHYPCDEAYYLDCYSILEVKTDKATQDKKENLVQQLRFYRNNLAEQIGDQLLSKILNSVEYTKLKDANLKLFELIDNCKKYQINAQAVDQYNYRRWELKNDLQKKFFGKSTTETKLGYRNNEKL